MPIKGLSRREDTSPRFVSLGKLVKGGPKTKDGKVGPDLEHFRFKPSNGDAHELEQAFFDSYGSEPNYIKLYLPYDEMERSFSSWREDYGQNEMLKRRCDGECWVDWVEGPSRKHGYEPCTLPMKDSGNRCPECPLSYVGRLEIILPPLWEAGFIGLVTLETHSINDIGTIAGKLVQCEPLTGKEFILWREDRKMGVPIKGKRVAVEKSLIFIELTQEWLQMQYLEAAQRQAVARLGGEPLPSLPEPQESLEDEDDEEIVGEVLEEEPPSAQDPSAGSGPPSTNGTRPYAPETIKAKLAPIVAAGSGAPATDKQKSLVAGKLNECFAGDAEADKKRHTVTQYLFDIESLNAAEFRQGHVDAVLTWILLNGKTNGTGDYPLHPKAPAEAAGIVRAALEDAGQQVLF